MNVLTMCRLLLVTCFVISQVLRTCYTSVTINLNTSVREGSEIYQFESISAASTYNLVHSEFDCPKDTFSLTTSGSLTVARNLSTLKVSCVSGSLVTSYHCVVLNTTGDQDPQRLCVTINVSPNYTINDFSFVKSSYTGYLVEEQQNRSTVSGLSEFYASVLHLGPISSLQYRITPSNQFEIVTEDVTCYKYPHLVSTQPLDREQAEFYLLRVEAFFGENASDNVSAEVRIHLLDINDNTPIFTNTTGYQVVSISELSLLGTQVLQVSAVDGDAGTNAVISYNLRSPSSVFVCNHITGSISLLTPIDYESDMVYYLTVVAHDSGMPNLSAEINITINVVNMNEAAPVIQLPTMPVILTVDSRTVTLSGSDSDSTSVSLSKSGRFSENFELQRLSAFQFELTLTSFAGITSNTIDLLLTALDNGAPRLTSTAILTIQLPVSPNQLLTTSFLVFEVVEGVPIGSYVGRVELQIDGESYRILHGNTPAWFNISSTGELTTVAIIDYEIENQFNLTIEVMFGGEVTRSLTVIIDVVDVNDNSPHFLSNITTTTVSESADVIFIFSASDDDGECNEAVHYHIQYAEPDVFSLDPLSGVLSPKYNGAVDFEQFQSARVLVRAVDQAFVHPRSAETLLEITITNANDHVPVVTSVNCPCWVTEETNTRQECLPVTAYDVDVSQDNSIRFSIHSGNNANAFDINETSGVVFTQRRLDHETQDVYNLGIVASDGVHESLPVNLTVIVIDINDSPPTYPSSLRFSVTENLKVGQVVASVAARHADAGYNALTNYAFASGTSSNIRDTFQLDPGSGQLLLQDNLSATNSPYTFTVKATDRLQNTQSASTTVEITVLSPPNQPPLFPLPEEYRTLASNAPGGTTVFQATAFDPNEGDVLSYSISPAHVRFSINQISGLVTQTSALSPSETSYNLVIVATDNGSPVQSSSMRLRISVYNSTMLINSVTYTHPALTQLCHFDTSLSEEPAPGSTILVLPSSQFFIIENEFASIFDISNMLLRVTNRIEFNRTEHKSIPLVLRSTYGSNNFNICSVTVTINDINDNPPVFVQSSLTIEVYKNTPVGSNIFQAVALDQDTGGFAIPRYSLSENLYFEIDEATGFVNVTRSLTGLVNSQMLVITATDSEQNSFTDELTLVVVLLGDNNRAPTFSGFTTFSISESVGHTIDRLNASDVDQGVYGLNRYCVASGDPRHLFSVQDDGDLVINQPLDRDSFTLSSYQLTVIAYDRSPNPVSTAQSIVVNVRDLNDEIPAFLSTNYTVAVSEDALVGTEVLRVAAVDQDSGTAGQIRYSINDTMVPFAINPISGVISTTSTLDREETANYWLMVVATDRGSSTQLTGSTIVLVEISDVNDNRPQFNNSILVQRTVREDTTVGSSVLQLSTHDADDGLNGDVVFSVQAAGTSPFVLDPVSGLITVSRLLDYETAPSGGYQLQLRALDRGSPPQSSEVLTLTLLIGDYNEMPPQFENTSYSFLVLESSLTRVPLFNVSAVDGDQGNGVAYSLIEPQTSNSFFEINAMTGTVQLRRSLNRNEFPFHQLEIIATDTGSPQLTSSVLVHVEISPISVAIPSFMLPYFIQVPDSTPVNSSVLWLHVEGYDPTDLGRVMYSITSGDTGTWAVTPTTGVLYLRSSLNHSLVSEYILTVRASRDGASSAGVTQVTIQVLQARVDHVPPSFDPNSDSVIRVTEDVMANSSFATLRAVGMSPFHYHIDGGTGFGLFRLSDSGELSSRVHPLSLLPSSAYILTVTVEDVNGLEQTEEFVVDVSELNHSPWFTSAVYNSTIRESSTTNQTVACVTAIDNDSGANGRLRYSIISGNTGQFVVDSSSGEVNILSDPLDYESLSEVRMLIRAADDGSLNTTALLIITVEDVNDRRPQIQPANITSIDVFDGFPAQREVIRWFVSDQDSSVNREVRYGSSSNNPFFVNTTTGAVMRNSSATLNAGDTFTIEVTAINVAQPLLSSVNNIMFTINVVSPTPQPNLTVTPRFATINVREDMPVGSVIYTVNATGSNRLMYGFIRTPSHFTIHPNSGQVYTAAPLDREQQSTHELLIEVLDGQQSRSFTLSIMIDNANDNTPRFNQTTYHFTFSESVNIGYTVGIINAVDLDGDDITYSLIQGRSPLSVALFEVRSNGHILTLQPLDRELLAVHELIVEATDGSSFGRAMVTLTLVDENDFHPSFSQSAYTVTVPEDATINAVILTVRAFDLDNGANGAITYQSTPTSLFSVNTTTGDVTLTSSLDYETLSHHSFNITATDAQSSSTAAVTVLVSDVADSMPQLCNLTHTVTVEENLNAFTPVANISKCNGERPVIFHITSGNELGHFVIDPSSGVVFSTIILDRERVERYTLMIAAIHAVGGPRRNVPLTIIIEDENDNRPQLNPPNIIVDVPENSTVLSTLYTFNITDRDSGNNGLVSIIRIYNFPASQYFLINSAGQMTLRRSLDREALFQSLRFQVYIYDSGTPPLVAAHSVTVNVLDSNEPPSFSSDSYTVTLATPAQVGTGVIFVVAADQDDGEFASLQYSISGGNGSDYFSIDPHSGNVMVSNNFLVQSVYHVVVVAVDGGGLQDTCNVFVLTRECPDSTLLFRPNIYNVDVSEDAALNTLLFTPVLLNFGRRNSNGIEFSLSVENSAFTINSTSGSVMLNGSLDRELQPVYQLVIQAIDGATNRLAISRVTLMVLDINDNSPVFQNTPYVGFVEDTISVGSLVTRVSATDRDNGSNAEIRYSLPSNTFGIFSINATSGEIHTTGMLVGVMLPSPVELTVRAQDGGRVPLSSEAVVSIHVMDSRAPLFSPLTYTANVSEGATIGTPVITVSAMSRSGISGATITYTIVSGDDLSQFTIGSVSGVVSVHMLLDYEILREYQLELRAQDMTVSLSTITFLTINVTDTNDNRPVFTQGIYTANVIENATLGTMLTQVNATDIDTRVNKEISYRLPTNSYPGVFRIDPRTGWVSLSGSLDREMACSNLDHDQLCLYNFPVEAVDGGTPSLTGTAQIRIAVSNINDNHPEFTKDVYTFSVEEDESPGGIVGFVVAIDADGDDVQYSLINSINGRFILDTDSGQLTLNSTFNDSDPVEYLLNVSACDPFLLCGFASINVTVTDVNNHFPIFRRPVYEAEVSEGVRIGEHFFTVTATDGDRGPNAAITYRIQDSFAPFFMIHNSTGQISAAVSLDRETRSFYELLVFAVDGGGLSGAATIRLTVTDVNDSPPRFSVPSYTISIPEGLPIQSNFLRVSAQDNDAGENGTLLYSIMPPNGTDLSQLPFDINHNNGDISVRLTLIGPVVVNFSVAVRDQGIPPLSGEPASVMVTILDTNRSPPAFSEPFYNAAVQEEEPRNTFVIDVFATAVNSTVTYQLLADTTNQFMIFVNNGTIVTRRSLDRESQDEYKLQVMASIVFIGSFGMVQTLTSFVNVNVCVTDVNERPEFTVPLYSFSILENSPINTPIVGVSNITGQDDDLGNNGTIRYQLGTNNDPFYIDAIAGVIYTNGSLDHETKVLYTLMVEIHDLGNPPLSSLSPVTVYISILDENDSPPVFPNTTYYIKLLENVTDGTEVLTVTATDEDPPPNNMIFYYFNGTSPFTIDSSTGLIRVSSALDRETTGYYEITITASDARVIENATHVSNATLSVTILDVNDETPRFNLSQYSYTIEENFPVGQVFIQLTATDLDLGINSIIMYSLMQGAHSDHFTINATTGQISFAVTPDHEALDTVEAIIIASDRGGLEGLTRLVVTILDENDNHPVFSNNSYHGFIRENSSVGTDILHVLATDRDDSQNGQIFYALFGGNQKFAVENNTGMVYTTAVLDREQQSLYNLTIQARDMGVPSLATNVTALVMVTDVNDNPPEFAQDLFQINISESAPVGSLVVQIMAVDRDEGSNANLTYEIVSGNHLRHFRLESNTSKLYIDMLLNYEQTPNYFITVQASDGGAPALTDTTNINITVVDANDHIPIFQSPQYIVRVEENITVSHVITTVSATDRDSGANARIEYSIMENAKSPEIGINSTTGEIFVVTSLDYETRVVYNLIVTATDMGQEQNTASADVQIMVVDVNDNSPEIRPVNATTAVRENSEVGQTILTLTAVDADSVSNPDDIKYYIMSGNEGNQFSLNRDTGILQSRVVFDREEQASYLLVVTAEDNGSPPLTGTSYVTIEIIDEDDSRPSSAQTSVFIYRYRGNTFPQILGTVYIDDPDVNNSYTYTTPDVPNIPFTVNRNGMIFYPSIKPTAKNYTVSVTVQDENGFTAISTVKILVLDVGEAMLKEAVFLQLVGVSNVTFAHKNYIKFQKVVASKLQTQVDMVHLFGLQPSVGKSDGLDVQLAVQTSSNSSLRRRTLEHFLHKFRREIMLETGVEIFTERADLCASEPCGDRGVCSNIFRFSGQNLLVRGMSVILVGVHRVHQYKCNCLPGYSGEDCENGTFDFCHSSPCPPFANCSSTLDGYRCSCPPGTTLNHDNCRAVDCELLDCTNGGSCDVTSSGLKCSCPPSFVGDSCEIPLNIPDVCTNNKPCHAGNCTYSHAGYTCTCPTGITGNDCGSSTTTNNGGCFQNPCQHGATCNVMGNDFNCICPAGYTGRQCDTFLYATEGEQTTNEPVSCQEDSCSTDEQCVVRDNVLLCATNDCASSPCLNNGMCFPQYPGFYCFCPGGFDGPRCEETQASFAGSPSSYAVFPSTLQQQLTGNIHLEFVTSNTSGLLLYSGRFDNQYSDVLVLQLVNGMLQLNVSYGGRLTLLSSNVTLNDALWHEIDIQHNSTVSTTVMS